MLWFILIAALLGGICGLMAAIGGDGKLEFRRQYVPAIIAVFYTVCLLVYKTKMFFLGLTALAYWGVYSLGYGIPDAGDKGSTLGRLWYKVFKGNAGNTVIATRTTVGLLKSLVLVSVPVLSGQWLLYIAYVGLVIFNQILWSRIVTGLKSFKLGKYNLLWEETLLNGIDVFLAVLLVLISFFVL